MRPDSYWISAGHSSIVQEFDFVLIERPPKDKRHGFSVKLN